MSSPLDLFLTVFGCMALWMTMLWVVQVRRNEADIVDAGWAFGLALAALLCALAGSGDSSRRVLLAVLAGAWGMRLGAYIYIKRVRVPGEDGRYALLRQSWKKKAHAKFFVFFQLQGALVAFLSLSFIAVALNSRADFGTVEMLAVVLSCVSILGESLADLQLSRFRSDPQNRGKTCQRGLWAYSRHPNYFFEWLHWWSYLLLAIGSPYMLLALPAPALMLFLILKVTGIPPTEARALETRGDDYRAYQRTVSAFIPWIRRTRESA